MADGNDNWFQIFVFIVALLAIGLLIADIVYFQKLREGQSISKNTATTLIILNVILLVHFIIMVFWAAYRFLYSSEPSVMVANQPGGAIPVYGVQQFQ
jgi:uncharacterized BrkB/YihY/UPF0761 family membrane protein